MRHFVIVAILVITMAVLTYVGLDAAGLMPEQASAQAIPIDWMWNLQVIAMSFLFALIVVPLFYSLVVFRRKKGETGDGEHIEGNTRLEVTWTVLPLIAVLAFAFLGAKTLGDTRRVDPQAMEIKVNASQFAFSFEYPAYGGVISKDLYLPINKQVVLKMESRDVIHSFWVPEFRVKQDIVPGRVTLYRITPTLEGEFNVLCAELCGGGHAYMVSKAIVVPQGEFDSWVVARQADAANVDTPEARGQQLAVQNGCIGCHSFDGTALPGPTWFGLYGAIVELSDGSTVTADDAFIIESIVAPQAKIVKGFEQLQMAAYNFTDEELADIIAFIKTLK